MILDYIVVLDSMGIIDLGGFYQSSGEFIYEASDHFSCFFLNQWLYAVGVGIL